MCGRYLIDEESYSDMWETLNLPSIGASPRIDAPPYAALSAGFVHGEVFPTNIAPVVTVGGVETIKWGFPHWKGAGVIINARAETAREKTLFRKPLAERRCVVTSSGFFEWRHVDGKKKKDKHLLRRPGERAVYMAGVVDVFLDASGCDYSAFVILTTCANSSVAPIHNRMPVILAPDELEYWLNDGNFAQYALCRPGPELMLEPAF
ncbi:MAG: SOS response-associated peptidase [Oscillospiraceae bacterium]|nr:SOS response-associated peptidase [Oscillospiraceae bacterium]